MTRLMPWVAGVVIVTVLLALTWWGWQSVGLGALQLGMTC